jgi:ubiquinone/menaquinone biosynthesis C-methylase UbiE
MQEWFKTFDDSLWLLAAKGADDEGQARFIKQALKLRKGQSILDAPCGRGRIAFQLAKCGQHVTGFDRNHKFLATARQRFRRHGLRGNFLRGDLRQLSIPGSYHAILNWFTSFGYFNDAENKQVLSRFAALLIPGGRLLIDVPNRERMLRNFESRIVTPNAVISNRWNSTTQRLASNWVPTAQLPHAKRSSFSLRMYTLAQLTRLLSDLGLHTAASYGNSKGDPLIRSSRRLIIVARKQR